jgi:signal transduction histidine kinase
MYARKNASQPSRVTRSGLRKYWIKTIEMSPAEALHLFRIMQEALQNTIKHAGPQNILVMVESTEAIRFTIKDDGVGFDEYNIVNGNGLLNMQHRAKEAGYELKLFQGKQGTEIQLSEITANSSLIIITLLIPGMAIKNSNSR